MVTPIIKDKARAINCLADILVGEAMTSLGVGYIYGIQWKNDPSVYTYICRTKWPSFRIRVHSQRVWNKREGDRFVQKEPSKGDNIEMAILLKLEKHPYLFYEYEHRFSLEYLRRDHPLMMLEFYTDQTIPDYDYISARLDDTHIKSLMSDPFGWLGCNGYHPTYHELYTAIREKTGTVDYQPAITEPRVWSNTSARVS